MGAEVLLDGAGSTDADGDPLTYRWTFTARPNGSVAALDNVAAPKPHFIVDRAGRYVLSLIVNDGNQNSIADTVVIDTENSKPVADAGPDQTVATGDTVYLNGSASRDPDGDALQYTWTLQESSDSHAELNFADSANPHFTATKAGRYVVHLVVSDGKLNSEADLVIISTRNSAPVADAGPDQNITLGDPALTLHGGNSSDVDGQTLTYRWAILNAPDGSSAGIEPFNVAEPGFNPDRAGLYVVQLIVNDGEQDSAPDTAQINVASPPPPPNQAPKITTSPRTTGTVGQLYSYDVDATDPDISDILGYSLQVSGPGMIIDSVSGLISWTPTEAGDFEITAKVQDQGGLSDIQNYTLKISAAPPVNRAPQITSTPVTTATAGQLYSYDVDATDPDGDTLAYALTQSPEGMSIDNNTGLIQWTPPGINVQPPAVAVRVTDTGGLPAEQDFTLTVAPANRAPVAMDDAYQMGRDSALKLKPTVLFGVNSETNPDVLYRFDKTTGAATAVGPIRDNNGNLIDVGGDVGLAYNPYIDRLYLVDGGSDVPTKLMSVDPATGITETIGSGLGVDTYDPGLAFDLFNKRLYMLTEPGEVSSNGTSPLHNLYEINLNTGVAVFIGSMNTVPGNNGLDYNWKDKKLYATFGNSPITDLFTIDALSAQPTRIGSTGARHLTGLAYDPELDTIFASDSQSFRLYKLGPTTAAATLVGAYGLNNVEGLAIQADPRYGQANPTPQQLGSSFNDYDPDGDAITTLLISGPANGTVNLSPDGSFTYTPNAGFVGTDTFTYKASDGKLDSNLATVTITVTEANQPPVITSTPNTSHWIQLNPNGTKPPARYSATQRTYDEFNDRLIVFGGLDSNSQRSLNDVWVLANASGLTGIPEWQKLEPTGTKPANRAGFVSAYDPTANRLIVYSGCTGFCASVGDAWVLTHANGLGGNPEWLTLPAGPVMGFGTGDYDSVTNRLVVFGGLPGGPGSDWSKLQILEDANGIGNPHWTQLNPAGPLPPPRGHDQPGVYDPLSNTFILFGGITSGPSSKGYNDVWVLSHANGVGGTTAWTELHPVGTAPPPGFHHMTYDPNSARLIVYGGQEYPPATPARGSTMFGF